jgi:hypothetical protein
LEKLSHHANDEPMPVEIVRPVVPPGVANVVRRLMAKSPAERFQTPDELAAALARYSELHPVLWAAKPKHPLSLSAVDEPVGGDDPSDLSTGSTIGAAVSGTLSLADFASALSPTARSILSRPDYEPEPALGLRARFLLAIAFGFFLGVALIVAAAFLQ